MLKYEFKCTNCGTVKERPMKFRDIEAETLPTCHKCGKPTERFKPRGDYICL